MVPVVLVVLAVLEVLVVPVVLVVFEALVVLVVPVPHAFPMVLMVFMVLVVPVVLVVLVALVVAMVLVVLVVPVGLVVLVVPVVFVFLVGSHVYCSSLHHVALVIPEVQWRSVICYLLGFSYEIVFRFPLDCFRNNLVFLFENSLEPIREFLDDVAQYVCDSLQNFVDLCN